MAFLGMGQLLQRVELENHSRIVLSNEEGYTVRCYILRVSVNDPKIDVIDKLTIGSKVVFTGEWRGDKETMDDFRFDSIAEREFVSCPTCAHPMVDDCCVVRHDKEARKLTGTWKVIHKRHIGRFVKIFFEKGHFVFGAVSCSKLWFHQEFKDLIENDIVELEGWRYQTSTTLKYVRKCI